MRWAADGLLDEGLCSRLESDVEFALGGEVADADLVGPAGRVLSPLEPVTARSFAAAALGSAKVTLPLGEDVPVVCDSMEPSVLDRVFLTR